MESGRAHRPPRRLPECHSRRCRRALISQKARQPTPVFELLAEYSEQACRASSSVRRRWIRALSRHLRASGPGRTWWNPPWLRSVSKRHAPLNDGRHASRAYRVRSSSAYCGAPAAPGNRSTRPRTTPPKPKAATQPRGLIEVGTDDPESASAYASSRQAIADNHLEMHCLALRHVRARRPVTAIHLLVNALEFVPERHSFGSTQRAGGKLDFDVLPAGLN